MKVVLPNSIKNVIDVIIRNENYENPEIEINQGSESGDGYASKTYAVSIKGKKPLNLFIKCTHDVIKENWTEVMEYLFKTEYNFYNKIYPAFKRFEEAKQIEDPFNNVPKFYGGDVEDDKFPPIVLENLRTLGYKLRDRKKPIDDDHLKIPIKAFAKYHAISFALKDQEPKMFEKLSEHVKDVFGKNVVKMGMADMIKMCVKQFSDSLDPISDKAMLDKCKNLDEKMINFALKLGDILDEYCVIVQGDCWSNNMMFLYDDETQKPIDIKLIDWQGQSLNSPLLDFNYFFYTLATKKELDNAHYYLNLYYNILSERIRELGSDPNKVYPYNVFLEHWRKSAMFGLFMAFCVIKAQLVENDEIPNMMDESGDEFFGVKIKNQDKYNERIRDLIEYFINQKLL
ncbi:uncharacterized protein [Onthophagus taurus]|uniref:uncharacterized protein n=1 Tax=Onthophagus taurus TaxID=166361 RepID=UPI0039BE8C31